MYQEVIIKSIKKYSENINKRINHVFLFLILFLALVSVKLIYIQVFSSGKLETLCNEQNQFRMKLPANRGEILDKNGNVIATNIKAYNLYVIKPSMTNAPAMAYQLERAGVGTYGEMLERLNSSMNYIPIAYNLNSEQLSNVKALNSDAIVIKAEKIRYYIKPEVNSGLVGFVGIDNTGLEGLEYGYNDLLSGKDGSVVYQRKPNGRIYKHPDYPESKPVSGRDLELTIDSRIQEFAYAVLDEYASRYNAQAGNIIVMEVKTGDILAMVNYPSYDGNLYGKGNVEDCRNNAVLALYEPGSIFKLVPAAAAIEYGKIKDTDMCKVNRDSLVVNGHVITDAHETGNLNFREAFAQSSNIAFVNIGDRIGSRLLYVMINAMGFNRKVDIGLPSEQKGLLLEERKWIPIHQANICFGQGILVSSLQMLAAYNIAANDGVYIKPSILKDFHNGQKKRIIKKSTSEKLTSMLVEVVNSGTGVNASVPGITIAGKTGTAEKGSDKGGYAKGKYVSSFVGYFPAENPEIIMIVTVDEPRGIYWGSEVAAPMFRDITKRILAMKEYRHLIEPVKEIHI